MAELTLEQLGWNATWAAHLAALGDPDLLPGRVAIEDKHQYHVFTARGELRAQVAGRLLHQARSPAELPKVGDWVALRLPAGSSPAIIQAVLPRQTRLTRKVPGRRVAEQVLVANIHTVFAVQALDRTLNPSLLQRHLVMAREGGAAAVVVLNKADLCTDRERQLEVVRQTAGNIPLLVVSARTGTGLDELRQQIRPGETVVLIGPSGVGKSSLINALYGEEIQATAEVRATDFKGRHTTTWRQMIPLPGGGLVIDTPGMREFHMWLADEGLETAFADIEALAAECHFRDCSHTHEVRCAVRRAVEEGRLARDRYENYLKLRNEIAYLEEARRRQTYASRRQRAGLARRAFDTFRQGE